MSTSLWRYLPEMSHLLNVTNAPPGALAALGGSQQFDIKVI